MKLAMAVGASLILLVAGGYALYQLPEVRSLFAPVSEPGEDPLAFLEDDTPRISRQKQPATEESRPEAPRPPQRSAPAASSEPRAVEPKRLTANDLPARQLTRVLLGILKAKGLAYGISIGVTDSTIVVDGEVNSEETKEQILDIIEKGRGSRKVDAANLIVKP